MAKQKDNKKVIQEILNELLDLLAIEADVKIEKIKEDESVSFNVNITPKNNDEGLLIGAHGANLEAIESFLNIAVRQKVGEWVRINLEIGEWRKKQKDNLVSLGEQAAKRARETKEPQYLYNLTSQQRREIHVSLKSDDKIETFSEGEGENRYLVIKPK